MSIYLIIIGVFLIFIAAVIFYYYQRDSAKNNFRRARKHHKIAEELYSEGSTEEAEEHYEISREYREKAEKQMKGEL